MKIISTFLHGIIDYSMAFLLIFSPWIFSFPANDTEGWIPIAIGTGIALVAILTKFELGAVDVIPMRTHLLLDILAGAFLALSPWLFGFHQEVYLPHLILGVSEVALAFLTKSSPPKGYKTL